MTSVRLSETIDIILPRYHISMTPAYILMAQACIGIVLDNDVIIRDSLKDFPLPKYAV